MVHPKIFDNQFQIEKSNLFKYQNKNFWMRLKQ